MTIQPANSNVPPPVALSRPLTGLDQAWRMAQALSQSSLLPDSLRNKAPDVLTMILYGQDLGLSPMQSIQGIYVVKGKPQLSAQTWIALTRRAGHRLSVLQNTAEACTVEITRGDTGEKHVETFTIDDARTAKLTSNDTYAKYPKRMLLARAVSNCCRFICPEIALGFIAEGEFEEPAGMSPEESLAHAVDARQPETDTADGDVHDAVVVDDPSPEDLARADEQARRDVMGIAAQHQQQGAADVPPGYECICGAVGEHFEDECPNSGAVR